MKIEKFEDIEAWQQARDLVNLVYESVQGILFSKDFGLKDQIQRASVSIMANIAEGFDSSSDVDFIKFLIYSRRSATEVQSHLYVALDRKYVTQKEFQELYKRSNEVKALIGGFIKYLRKPRPRT